MYSEPSQIPRIELFGKITNSFQLLTIFNKSSISAVSQASEYASKGQFIEVKESTLMESLMHEIFLLVQNSAMEVESFIKKYWKNDMKGNGGIFYCNYWAIINDVSTFALFNWIEITLFHVDKYMQCSISRLSHKICHFYLKMLEENN